MERSLPLIRKLTGPEGLRAGSQIVFPTSAGAGRDPGSTFDESRIEAGFCEVEGFAYLRVMTTVPPFSVMPKSLSENA